MIFLFFIFCIEGCRKEDETARYTMTNRSNWITHYNRDGSKLMQIGDSLYMYGGWTSKPLQSNSDIFRSSGDLSVWQEMHDATWPGRHSFGIGKIDSTLYIFGGDQYTNVFDVWKTTDGMNFTLVNADLSSTIGNRLLYGACVHKGKLYVLGGQSRSKLNSGLTDVWSSADGIFWEKIASNKKFLGKNISGTVVSYKNKIWVLGGGYYKHPQVSRRWTNEVYSSPNGIDWRREPHPPWGGRQYADACVWNNKLWVIGGDNGENLSDIWYMREDGSWHEFETPEGYTGRHATAVGVYNDQLVIACGNYHNDCWVIEKE